MEKWDRRTVLKALCGCCVAAVGGGVATARPKQKYYMLCATCRGDKRFGPDRATNAEAQKDVDAHLKKYPEHDAVVFGPVEG